MSELSAIIMQLEQVDHELTANPGRVTEEWAAQRVAELAEQMFRVSSHIRHGERG